MSTYSEEFMNVSDFAEYTGLSRNCINSLRAHGVIPYFGRNPVYIPVAAACAAIVRHAEQTSAAAQKDGDPDEV